ncbi:hypothetical protein VPH35_110015 [Triticum aestivum]
MHASKLRFRSGVVRIRSTTSVCLLHGLVLLPCGISVAGSDDTSAGDAIDLSWELNEDLGRCYVSFHVDQYWSPVGTIGDLTVGLSSFLLASSVVGLCVYSV